MTIWESYRTKHSSKGGTVHPLPDKSISHRKAKSVDSSLSKASEGPPRTPTNKFKPSFAGRPLLPSSTRANSTPKRRPLFSSPARGHTAHVRSKSAGIYRSPGRFFRHKGGNHYENGYPSHIRMDSNITAGVFCPSPITSSSSFADGSIHTPVGYCYMDGTVHWSLTPRSPISPDAGPHMMSSSTQTDTISYEGAETVFSGEAHLFVVDEVTQYSGKMDRIGFGSLFIRRSYFDEYNICLVDRASNKEILNECLKPGYSVMVGKPKLGRDFQHFDVKFSKNLLGAEFSYTKGLRVIGGEEERERLCSLLGGIGATIEDLN